MAANPSRRTGLIDAGNIAITGGTILAKSINDTRKLSNWFKGSLVGKKVVWWGDSTTEQLAGVNLIPYAGDDVVARQIFIGLSGTIHYNYGTNGQTLAGALAASSPANNAGGVDCSVAGVVARAPDVVVMCWGLNDMRANAAIAGASYDSSTSTANAAAIAGAQSLQANLVSAITRLTAALPNVCIILRMPNGFNAVNGGGTQTYFTQTGVNSQHVQDVLRLAYRGDASTSTPIPQLDQVYSNVILWDSQASVYPETAYAVASPLVTGTNDNLHPSGDGYKYIVAGVMQLLVPQSDAGNLLGNAQTQAAKIETTVGRGYSAINTDTGAPLDLSDWKPVYACSMVAYTAGSFTDVNFGSATAGLDAFGSAAVGPGLCVGDVIVFTVSGVDYAVPVLQLPSANQGSGTLRWFSSPGFSPSKRALPAAVVVGSSGIVYRHKWAFSLPARMLMNTGRTYNPYKNAYRFRVVSAASGSCVLGSIANEAAANGQQFHSHTLATTDVLCLAGVEGAVGSIGGVVFGQLGLAMTSATQGAVANQQYTLTLAGTDFRNSIGAQGFLLSST